MRARPLVAAIGAALAAACAAPGATRVSASAEIGFREFDAALSPYGEWIEVAPYGWVWRPLDVAPGWQPYFFGHWLYTDAGWLWASDEPFGWAVYHYGRWGLDPAIGWFWVPGWEWAPAWVAWRYGPGAVGWAPLGPGPGYGTSYVAVSAAWVFVPPRYLVATPVARVALPRGSFPGPIAQTRPAPPRAERPVARGGPPLDWVERHAGSAVAPVPLRDAARPPPPPPPSAREPVPVYRPRVAPRRGDERPTRRGAAPPPPPERPRPPG